MINLQHHHHQNDHNHQHQSILQLSRIKFKQILRWILILSLACLYVYGILYSHSASYITIQHGNPIAAGDGVNDDQLSVIMTEDRISYLRKQQQHGYLMNNITSTSSSIGNDGRTNAANNTSSSSSTKKNVNIELTRSLPHLRAFNTLQQETKFIQAKKKKEMKEQTKNNDIQKTKQQSTNESSKKYEKNITINDQTLLNDTIDAIIMLITFTVVCRLIIAILIYRRSNDRSFWHIFRTIPLRRRYRHPGSRHNPNDLNNSTFTNNVNSNRRIRNGRRTIQQQIQLLAYTHELNQRRIANGSQPIDVESLATLLSNRGQDFTSNDYESLLELQELNGSLVVEGGLSSGATEEEINRCPIRSIKEDDYDFIHTNNSGSSDGNGDNISTESEMALWSNDKTKCTICLEHYQVGDMIRTLPCFHSFHVDCIDPWLRQKATCPICKHRIV